MGTESARNALLGASALAVMAISSVWLAGCGSKVPDFVGSWTASGDCHLTGFARAEFAMDGGFRGAARASSMPESGAKTVYGARYAALCADVARWALPVDGTWHQDGPRVVVETSNAFGTTRVVLYHRVVGGTLTLASDGGFRDGVQTYEHAK